MKFAHLTAAVLCAGSLYAQTPPCGAEKVNRDYFNAHPEVARNIALFNLKLAEQNRHTKAGKQLLDNPSVYEIPVVVHVIHNGEALGTTNNPSDAAIQNWLNLTNRIYTGTAPGYPDTAVIPVRFVLAKRNEQCEATTGIERINGSNIAGYAEHGLSYNATPGATQEQLRALGRWDPQYYYNIYLVNTIDTNSTTRGFAYYAGATSDRDGAFMTVATLTTFQTIAAHEFGHAMGLLHVFEGTEYDSGECPPNSDCITDNDMVCDTAPVKGMLTANPYPSNTDVNPCSGVFYNNEQHNMMNYGIPTNFTTGQSERAIASVLQFRQSLLHSKGGLAPDGLEAAAQPLAACIPSGTTSTATYNIGPVRVTFRDIDNTSTGRNNSTDGYFDYNTLTCKAFGLTTVIPKNTATPLTVEIDINGQNIAAYIDYNNDGVFSSTTEMVLSAPNTASYGTATVQVTPPANVVLDTPLRMRVISDLTGHGILPCALSYYGQTEDYMVTVSNSLSVQSPEKQTGLTLYPNPAGNALSINSASTINTVEVLDSNGRSVLTGNYAANEAQLNLTGLSAGVYLVKVSSDQGVITKKIVKL